MSLLVKLQAQHYETNFDCTDDHLKHYDTSRSVTLALALT